MASASHTLKALKKREICFTLADDLYCRYQSFSSAAELKGAIMKKQPHKIDIGAVFNMAVVDHKSPGFRAEERELVFDVDLSDYDDVRTCCQGAVVCRKCWKFVCCAVKVMDRVLREDFGFVHVLWVYSGRRGVHCWVCDRVARELTNEARSAVVAYCSVNKSADKGTFSLGWPLHVSLKLAYDILEPIFANAIVAEDGQRLLADPEHWEKLVATLPRDAAGKITEHWHKLGDAASPHAKWEALKANFGATSDVGIDAEPSVKRRKSHHNASDLWQYETVFAYVYPRLDENVSKQRNHLLKAPFAVHPKTGRVCVPFDPAKVDDFDPGAVPTLRDLAAQIDQGQGDSDLAKTDLRHAVDYFKRNFLNPLLGRHQFRRIRSHVYRQVLLPKNAAITKRERPRPLGHSDAKSFLHPAHRVRSTLSYYKSINDPQHSALFKPLQNKVLETRVVSIQPFRPEGNRMISTEAINEEQLWRLSLWRRGTWDRAHEATVAPKSTC